MRILADENIPLAEAFFAGHGSVQRFAGRSLERSALAQADVLLVRSVTRVDRALLEGTPVNFVGTCTIGTDHLDLDYLAQAGIQWAHAPGCNARGVVDYVLGSLLALAEHTGADLASRCYGILGAGQVGGRLAAVLRQLGWQVRVCDPPRQAQEGGDFVSLEQLLADCDVISLHTPLTQQGAHPTQHLFDQARLAALRPGSWLINASRGPVVDNAALLDCLLQRPDLQAVLDVWEYEPSVDKALAQRCRIATPHIAGHSLEGKLRGTAQIYQAFCAAFGVSALVQLEQLMPALALRRLEFSAETHPDELLTTLCRAVYDPRRDDAAFRRMLNGDAAAQRSGFDLLRKQYPVRREIDGLQLSLDGENPALERVVRALGAALCQTPAHSECRPC